jgi:hypothetical protein
MAHEGGGTWTDRWAVRARLAVVRRGCRVGAWRGLDIELRGARLGLGKARALGRRAASGGACAGAERGAAPVGSICFAVPLFEHAKLQNFE